MVGETITSTNRCIKPLLINRNELSAVRQERHQSTLTEQPLHACKGEEGGMQGTSLGNCLWNIQFQAKRNIKAWMQTMTQLPYLLFYSISLWDQEKNSFPVCTGVETGEKVIKRTTKTIYWSKEVFTEVCFLIHKTEDYKECKVFSRVRGTIKGLVLFTYIASIISESRECCL